jgi:hypothetical protein
MLKVLVPLPEHMIHTSAMKKFLPIIWISYSIFINKTEMCFKELAVSVNHSLLR